MCGIERRAVRRVRQAFSLQTLVRPGFPGALPRATVIEGRWPWGRVESFRVRGAAPGCNARRPSACKRWFVLASPGALPRATVIEGRRPWGREESFRVRGVALGCGARGPLALGGWWMAKDSHTLRLASVQSGRKLETEGQRPSLTVAWGAAPGTQVAPTSAA